MQLWEAFLSNQSQPKSYTSSSFSIDQTHFYSMKALNEYVNKVDLSNFSSYEIKKSLNYFNTAYKNFHVKVMRPMKKFCQKQLSQDCTIENLQIVYLQYVLDLEIYKEGLSIMHWPTVNGHKNPKYLQYCSLINLQLGKFDKAQENIDNFFSCSLGYDYIEQIPSMVKYSVMLETFLNTQKLTKQKIQKYLQYNQYSASFDDFTAILYRVVNKEVLNKQQLTYLSTDDEKVEILMKDNINKMRKICQENIQKKIYRIKKFQFLFEKDLQNIQNVLKVNVMRIYFKYDSIREELFFVHDTTSVSQINAEIQICSNIYNNYVKLKKKNENKKKMCEKMSLHY